MILKPFYGLPKKVIFCKKCVMSNQRPRIVFNNDGDQLGIGYFSLTTKNGRRCSSARAFLTPIKSRNNLTIITDAQVKKLKAIIKCVNMFIVLQNEIKTVKPDPPNFPEILSICLRSLAVSTSLRSKSTIPHPKCTERLYSDS